MEEGLLSVAPACNSTTTNALLNNHCAGNVLYYNRRIAFSTVPEICLEVNGVPAPCGSLACVCALYGVSPSYALEVEFAAESLYCNTICVVYQKLHASGFNRQYL